MADPACRLCRWWHNIGTSGECRSAVPTPSQQYGTALWARTKPNDWCGHFMTRDAEEPAD